MTAMLPDDVLVNSDMGESLGLHSFGHDADLMPLLDVANVACGFHSGDPTVMDETVRLAAEHGVAVGAHPGLPDLVGFGRREMKLTPDEVESIIRYQVGALRGFLAKYDLPLNHIKPHGSLYGMLARDESLMAAAARVARTEGVPVYGMAGTAHERVAEAEGVAFVPELYVDLDYNAEGGLVILRRTIPLYTQVVAERVRRALTTGTVEADDGTELRIPFRSICIHSDTENCAAIAAAVRATITALSSGGEAAPGAASGAGAGSTTTG